MTRPRVAGRVLLVFHEEVLGGASLALLRVLPLLEARGWTFECWAPTGGELERELRARGMAVTGLSRQLRFSLASLRQPPGPTARLRSGGRYLRRFSRFVRSGGFDLVHANTLLALPEAALSSRARVPVVLHVHEMLPEGAKGWAAGRVAGRAADVVVAVSGAPAQALESRGVSARVVHNGIAPPGALVEREPRSNAVVGTVGTVSRRKGTDLFVELAKRLSDAPLEFRILGPVARGPEAGWASALVREAERAGVEVRFSSDVAAELPGWDVFVLASREDPFPLAVLEAMAAGLTVVATRTGGISEQLTEETGILVEPDDVVALAEAVRALVDDPARRDAMGRAGRARVEAEFTLERQAEGLDLAYREALDESARPSGRA